MAYHRHVEASLQLMEGYADDYVAFGHWVPQFIVYAVRAGEDVGLSHVPDESLKT